MPNVAALTAKAKPAIDSVLQGVPSWVLGGLTGGVAGGVVDREDRLRGALHGAGIGALGGYLFDRLPGAPVASPVSAVQSPKLGFINPSISSGGAIGLGYSGGAERLPGTSTYADRDVIQRAGRAYDEGGDLNQMVAAGADSPKSRYMPIAASVLGGLVGKTLHNSPGAWLGGSAIGLGAGYLGKSHMQKAIDSEAQDASKGLLIERANLGDPRARQLLMLSHGQ
jgi:hypothetical protein